MFSYHVHIVFRGFNLSYSYFLNCCIPLLLICSELLNTTKVPPDEQFNLLCQVCFCVLSFEPVFPCPLSFSPLVYIQLVGSLVSLILSILLIRLGLTAVIATLSTTSNPPLSLQFLLFSALFLFQMGLLCFITL